MESNSPDIESWLKLIRARDVGPATFKRLLKYFKEPARVLGSNSAGLRCVKGVGLKTAENIISSANQYDAAQEIKRANAQGAWLVNMADERYPAALRTINDPPPVLYVKGSLQRCDGLAVAIVGSRRASLYGQEQAGRFAHLLASSGFTIVSGMARGVDTAAHRGALSAAGRTLAIQGCGLSKVFPSENRKLFEKIPESGACISELALDADPKPENFPARNRIIAGLSLATLVIEASERSGAMITARLALDYNRDVMAVPGKIDSPLNSGSHKLIKQGARLVDCIDDVMDALGQIGTELREHAVKRSEQAENKVQIFIFDVDKLNLSRDEKLIYRTLQVGEPIHIEEIIGKTNVAVGAVNAGLISLRLKGLVRQLPGNCFVKKAMQ